MKQESKKVPWYRNPDTRALLIQAITIAIVLWVAYSLISNTIDNLRDRGIQTGIGFMSQVAPFAFPLDFYPFWDYRLGESKYWEVFVAGVQNTMLVSALGIIAATLLGFLIGVMRLSPNWLIAKIAAAYIEMFRNIPLLLQIMFWNFAIFLPSLPSLRNAHQWGDAVYLYKAGLNIPKPIFENSIALWLFALVLLAMVVGLFLFRRWTKKQQMQTGRQYHTFWISLAVLVLVPSLAFLLTGSPIGLEYAQESGIFRLAGGMQIPLPLFALWFALTIYTAAFIGENVRGGIMAVSHGQTEAAHALGLRHGVTLRLVIIPQAMRVIVPPTISQFLNLTKNSSLAVAIGYPELVNVWTGIALNQTGQALIIIAMTIFVYEALSLSTSGFLNWYNKRVQLVER